MLKKLLKYDLKYVYKLLFVFYALSLSFAVLTRVFLNINDSFIMNIIGNICSSITIAMIFNILINNIIKLWVRFSRNFYGDESYLTHTLPVEKKTLYLSKTLASIITLLSSVSVIGISLFIAYYSKENIEFVKGLLLPLADVYDSTILSILISFLLIFFLEWMNLLQAGYSGIILGYRRNNSKMGYSVLYGYGIYMLTQIFVLLVIFICALFNVDLMNLFRTESALNIDVIKFCIYLSSGVYLLNIIVLYFVNSKLFNKGVNVD